MLQLIQALQTNNPVAQLWTHSRLVVDSTITPVEEITLCDPSTIETEEHIKELIPHDPGTLSIEGYHSLRFSKPIENGCVILGKF